MPIRGVNMNYEDGLLTIDNRVDKKQCKYWI